MLDGPGQPEPENDRGSVGDQLAAGSISRGPDGHARGGRAGTMSDENGRAAYDTQGAMQSSEEGRGVPSGRSKEAHAIFHSGYFVFISLNVKTAGEDVGVVQLSAEIIRLELVSQCENKREIQRKDRRWG